MILSNRDPQIGVRGQMWVRVFCTEHMLYVCRVYAQPKTCTLGHPWTSIWRLLVIVLQCHYNFLNIWQMKFKFEVGDFGIVKQVKKECSCLTWMSRRHAKFFPHNYCCSQVFCDDSSPLELFQCFSDWEIEHNSMWKCIETFIV